MSNLANYADYRCAECRYAKCRYAGCQFAECHYSECHYSECRYAKCHYSECRYSESRGTARQRRGKKSFVTLTPKLNTGTNIGGGVVSEFELCGENLESIFNNTPLR
jgi:hypothetical protein